MSAHGRFWPPSTRAGRVLLAPVAASAIALIVGAVLDPRRAAAAYLTGYVAVLSTVIGMLLLVMTIELSGGAWFAPLRRKAHAIIGTLPMLGLLFIPIVLGASALYPWLGSRDTLPSDVRHAVDATWPYLTPGFALSRAVIYWVIWIGLGEAVRGASVRVEVDADAEATARMRVLSAAGVIFVGLSSTFAAFDWLMSLAPEFVSSIFGLYVYAGATVGALALGAVLLGLDHWPAERGLSGPRSLHALGNLLLTFVLVWAYFGYSQFLILWIADIPTEIGWLAIRTRGGWGFLGLLLLIGHFALPFLLLLVRRVKESPRSMIAVGAWMLWMHFLDVVWLVGPSGETGLGSLWLDLASLVFVSGLTTAVALLRPRPDIAPSGVRAGMLAPAGSRARSDAR